MASVVSALFCTGPALAYAYVFATFTGDDAGGMKLSLYTSADALNFTLLSNTGFGGSSGYIRDPSIMKNVDGMYYVAYTDPLTDSCCGKEDHFSIAKSADLIHWVNLTTVDAGVPGVAHTWAPEWYIEGGTVYVTANIDTLNTDSDFKPYLFTALDSTLTSWSAPVPLGFGPNYIDTFVLKVGATYHAFAKNETTRYCEHATAPALTGPWTFVGTGNWAGWGSGMEGPAVVQLDDGTWRIFMDGQGSVPFVTATSPDLSKWSAWVALPGLGDVVRHGTVIRDVPTGAATAPADAGGLPDAGRLPDAATAGPDGGAATVPMDGGAATVPMDAGNQVPAVSEEGGDASTGQPDASEAGGSTPAAIAAGPSDSGMGFPAEGSPEAIAGGASAKGGCACHVVAPRERGAGGAAAVLALLVLAGIARSATRRGRSPMGPRTSLWLSERARTSRAPVAGPRR
jgi:hypothetical protein